MHLARRIAASLLGTCMPLAASGAPAEGDSVAFRAERRDGENVLTAIRPAPPCKRFEKCE